METPQHGNGSKISGNPSKVGFLRCFRDFFKFFRNPSKFKFLRSFLFFFDRFTRIVYLFPLYFIQIYTDKKFEETDQQIEMFKVFEKSGNGSKISGNGHKI